jgi:hypothetical protein
VRGVLEIIRPLDDAVAKGRARLQWVFIVSLSVIAAVMGVLVLILVGLRFRKRH